jgi:molybdenum cofactor cytidylyltransferase
MTALRILLPAAGAASRMRGGDKLLEQIKGTPLLQRQAARALQISPEVVVTLRAGDTARQACLQGLAVRLIFVADADEGMAASLRAGTKDADGAVMILPADMPEIDTADLRALTEAMRQDPSQIWRGATADGIAGHPVIFPADLLPAFQTLSGDLGARAILAKNHARIRLCPLPARHALTDLDTPEDWQSWRANQI